MGMRRREGDGLRGIEEGKSSEKGERSSRENEMRDLQRRLEGMLLFATTGTVTEEKRSEVEELEKRLRELKLFVE